MMRAVKIAALLAFWASAPTLANADKGDAAKHSADTMLQQIDAATRTGRLVQAEAMLSELERGGSTVATGKVALHRAEFYMAKGDATNAADALYLADDDSAYGCRHSRLSGWIAGKKSDWNTAILKLSDAVENCSDDASLWNLLGLALIGKREFAASLEAFDSALILLPNHPGLLNNRALALVSDGKHEAAMLDLRRAAIANPGDVSIRDNIDYLSGVLGIALVRDERGSDASWAARLTKAGEGARDANRSDNATAYFANAALLSDRFDAQVWAQGLSKIDQKAD
jgi:Flp pilus assembly protein TadD